MSSSPTAAVIGTGFIGPVHVEALRRAGIKIAGILGSNVEKSEAAAEKLGLPRGYGSLDELLGDSAVDVVHITSPNRFHFEQATACLNAGKHVLCEKPLAMNSEQTRQLVDLAQSVGRAAAVAYNIRFYPLCHQAASLVRKEPFGDFLHVQGSYVQDWLLYPNDFNWRVQSEHGGKLRAVADIGTHWLDLIQFISGQKVSEVFSELKTIYPQRHRPVGGSETFSGSQARSGEQESISIDTEDCGTVLLRFSNNATGCLWVSQMTAGRKNCLRFELGGSNQSLSWNSESPNELWIGQRDSANQTLLRDPAMLDESASNISNYPGGHNEGFPDTFKQLMKSFYAYVEQGDLNAVAKFPTFADGHYEVQICEAILRSHQEKMWIKVGEN